MTPVDFIKWLRGFVDGRCEDYCGWELEAIEDKLKEVQMQDVVHFEPSTLMTGPELVSCEQVRKMLAKQTSELLDELKPHHHYVHIDEGDYPLDGPRGAKGL